MGLSPEERRYQNFGPEEYREYIHDLPCSIRKCKQRPIEQAHWGQHGKDSWKRTLPLCRHHHAESHRGVQTFQKRYDINLQRVAEEVYQQWLTWEW